MNKVFQLLPFLSNPYTKPKTKIDRKNVFIFDLSSTIPSIWQKKELFLGGGSSPQKKTQHSFSTFHLQKKGNLYQKQMHFIFIIKKIFFYEVSRFFFLDFLPKIIFPLTGHTVRWWAGGFRRRRFVRQPSAPARLQHTPRRRCRRAPVPPPTRLCDDGREFRIQ